MTEGSNWIVEGNRTAEGHLWLERDTLRTGEGDEVRHYRRTFSRQRLEAARAAAAEQAWQERQRQLQAAVERPWEPPPGSALAQSLAQEQQRERAGFMAALEADARLRVPRLTPEAAQARAAWLHGFYDDPTYHAMSWLVSWQPGMGLALAEHDIGANAEETARRMLELNHSGAYHPTLNPLPVGHEQWVAQALGRTLPLFAMEGLLYFGMMGAGRGLGGWFSKVRLEGRLGTLAQIESQALQGGNRPLAALARAGSRAEINGDRQAAALVWRTLRHNSRWDAAAARVGLAPARGVQRLADGATVSITHVGPPRLSGVPVSVELAGPPVVGPPPIVLHAGPQVLPQARPPVVTTAQMGRVPRRLGGAAPRRAGAVAVDPDRPFVYRYVPGPLTPEMAAGLGPNAARVNEVLSAIDSTTQLPLRELRATRDALKAAKARSPKGSQRTRLHEELMQADTALARSDMACGNIAQNFDNYLQTGSLTRPVLDRNAPGSLVDLAGLPGRQTFNKTVAQNALVTLLDRDGATALIHYQRTGVPGHFLNAKNINGEVWLFDAHEGVAFSTKDSHALLNYMDPLNKAANPAWVVPDHGVSISITSLGAGPPCPP